ncbi:polycomb group RING finger protein 3 [Biomphalaria glabrata]|uniref:Polycomb group RING finger protein 3-like n=1 Tax=Biomphalaria glabrata TaxID=6526 RepID=A0A2C9JDV0_BIOGL|nr:polycomb group RING finger protein 3-like [Biomphalaria glabrata]KAI8768233.1 polycomb group RING finger protein 3-like [Biomphalaria glabrata]KAI8777386.1 polycomb group RING finger protein 3 [Biomphalaria glabrata]
MMERKVRLKTVNPFITCYICKGYLIDSTTITECLHTFCKSCIVKYLEEKNTCPKCHIEIHQSYPLNYISFDRTMQDIVYKLVPNLQEKEFQRMQDFYRKRGLTVPSSIVNDENSNECNKSQSQENHEDEDHHRSDEQVNICLECRAPNLKHLKRRYLRISSQATITHLKKFVALKLYNNINRFKEVDILCNEEILGKDHTLKFVSVTRWRSKDAPLLLHYRQRVADL